MRKSLLLSREATKRGKEKASADSDSGIEFQITSEFLPPYKAWLVKSSKCSLLQLIIVRVLPFVTAY